MQPIKLFTRLAVCLISLTLSGLIGCDHEVADAVVVQVDGIDRLPPQQIKKALGQLSATDARQQSQGLAFVEAFPSLMQTHRDLIEHLTLSGASPAVKKKATELLSQ